MLAVGAIVGWYRGTAGRRGQSWSSGVTAGSGDERGRSGESRVIVVLVARDGCDAWARCLWVAGRAAPGLSCAPHPASKSSALAHLKIWYFMVGLLWGDQEFLAYAQAVAFVGGEAVVAQQCLNRDIEALSDAT